MEPINKTIKVMDMPKLESPFVRDFVDGDYVVTPQIAEGYEWVFNDDSVEAIEKLHGTNVSVIIKHGTIVAIFNRTERIPFFNKGKKHIIEGVLNSYSRGMLDPLLDGQHFGELLGPKVCKNKYNLDGHLWIPFETYAKKHLRFKSWGKYPKTYEAISEWFKNLMPLYNIMCNGKKVPEEEKMNLFVEGVVFTHPDGRMAKLRRNMFPWFKGKRHKE